MAGVDGSNGVFFANAPNGDLHAVGSVDPVVPGAIGCIVIRPDGSRRLARVDRTRGRRDGPLDPIPN